VDGPSLDLKWNTLDYDDSLWPTAILGTPQRKMSPMLDPRRLYPRQIPMLPEIPSKFQGAVNTEGSVDSAAWTQLLQSDTAISIPANSKQWVELETETLTTGFLDLLCDVVGGDGQLPVIEILCSECYELPIEESNSRKKGDRTDFRNGKLYGMTDRYTLHSGENYYSPFWFRTFRYIRLTITTHAQPVTINSFAYRATHYPLNVRTTVESSSPLITKLWEISISTLRNCMHETYEDCPFYEQNQFAMDSRSQILFTYLVSRDDRLARKAIQEFYASRRDDGLVETHFPCPGRGMNIPTFSLFWVLMIYDHMVHFGDEKLVKTYISAADGVLDYFDKRINDLGLVGQFDADCWAFVDWTDGWFTPSRGFTGLAVPKAYYSKGAATFHSLLYAYVLAKASELQWFLGRRDTAAEYLARRRALLRVVRTHCFDAASGFFVDGPGATDERSQHVQVMAVLSGCCDASVMDGDDRPAAVAIDARALMRRTILECAEHRLAKASLAMGFYVFRAASEAGIYEEVWDTLTAPWRRMAFDEKMTTWAESESMTRSDCHGWSAVPLWEIGTEILGVRQLSPAYLAMFPESQQVPPRKSLVADIKADVLINDSETVHIEWGTTK
jgi:alpha-L-rhamnosidase